MPNVPEYSVIFSITDSILWLFLKEFGLHDRLESAMFHGVNIFEILPIIVNKFQKMNLFGEEITFGLLRPNQSILRNKHHLCFIRYLNFFKIIPSKSIVRKMSR